VLEVVPIKANITTVSIVVDEQIVMVDFSFQRVVPNFMEAKSILII